MWVQKSQYLTMTESSQLKDIFRTYCNFCSMLYAVAALTNSFDAEQVEKELDKIVEFEN